MKPEPDHQQPRFIVLEGIDGSGTTTQVKRVSAFLRGRGHTVLQTHQPSTGPIGQLTRELLAGAGGPRSVDAGGLALLFAADRLEHLQREIEPSLSRGEVVLCDRYVVSSWVYQSLECDPHWVRTINDQARWPDLTFVFDLPAEVGLARALARREASGQVVERYDLPEVQRRLAAGYTAILDEDLDGVVCVDAGAKIEAVSEFIEARCVAAGL